jgi:hypothetical protein
MRWPEHPCDLPDRAIGPWSQAIGAGRGGFGNHEMPEISGRVAPDHPGRGERTAPEALGYGMMTRRKVTVSLALSLLAARALGSSAFAQERGTPLAAGK